jgi:hypothetical protein
MAASAPPVATSAQTRRPPWAEEDRGALKAKLDWLQRDGKFRLTLPWHALQTFARMPMPMFDYEHRSNPCSLPSIASHTLTRIIL